MITAKTNDLWDEAEEKREEAPRLLDPDVKIWYNFLHASKQYLKQESFENTTAVRRPENFP